MKFGKQEYLATPDRTFKNKLKEYNPDIIHCQTKYGLLNYAFKYRRKHNIPVVTTIHTIYPLVYKSLKFKPLINYALKRVVKVINKCDGVIAVSNLAKTTAENLGITVPIQVIRNGIEIKDYNFDNKIVVENKAKFNIENDDFVIMYSGYLQERKNIMFQLKTLKILKQKTNKFKFLLAGDGEQKDKLQEYVKNNNLQENVIFTGFISSQKELYSLYFSSNLFFFTSYSDSDGLVIVESALNKTPSLVLKDMASCERITNNYNGFICENDPSLCADKIYELMNNKELLSTISQNAYQSIPKDWDNVCLDYENFYKETIKTYKTRIK